MSLENEREGLMVSKESLNLVDFNGSPVELIVKGFMINVPLVQ